MVLYARVFHLRADTVNYSLRGVIARVVLGLIAGLVLLLWWAIARIFAG